MGNNFDRIIITGDKFKAVRLRFSLTQGEFANRLGIGQSYYSLIESDKKQPSMKVIDKLIKMGVSSAWLFDGIGEMVINKIDDSNNTPLTCCELIETHKEQIKKYHHGIELNRSDYTYLQIKFYDQFNIRYLNKLIYGEQSDLEQEYNTHGKLAEFLHFMGHPKFLLKKYDLMPPYTEYMEDETEEFEEDMREAGIEEGKLKKIMLLLNLVSLKEHWSYQTASLVDYLHRYQKMTKEYILDPDSDTEDL